MFITEVDIEFDRAMATQKPEIYSSKYGNCDRRFSLSPNQSLIENHDGRHQLHEDCLHLRVVYKTDLDRGRYNIWRQSAAFHYAEQMGSSEETDHKCPDCGSRRCNRGSECSRLHQDVYRDLSLNDFQSNIGRFESRKRYDSGGSNWDFTIDKGGEEYQQRSFDPKYATESKITTPLPLIRKRTGLCQKFLQGQCWSGASCCYVHDVAGHYRHGHIPYMLADRGGRLSLSNDNSPAKDGYLYSADKLNSHSSKHQYKRCICTNADADGFFKKRRTEATWRHEDSYYSEEDGRISRNSISRGGHLQRSSYEQSWVVRRGNETVTENSSLRKASDVSLHTAESKGDGGWGRRKISFGESSNGNESSDSRSESSDANLNSCTRSREMNKNNEKQLTVKHSRKGSLHRGSPLRNRSGRAIQKHYSFKRKTHYYPDRKRLHLADEATLLCKYYLKGYCRRGNGCWFSHETDSSKAQLDLNEEKRSITKHKPVASNEPGQDLSSTNNSNRLLQKKNRSSGLIDKSMPIKSTTEQNDTTTICAETFSGTKCTPESYKHTRPARGKKCSGSSIGKQIAPGRAMRQECVDNVDQDGKGDDGCANYLVEGTDDKDSSVEQMVERKELFADPSLLILQNSVPDFPSVNLDSCLKVGKSEEPLTGHHVLDQADPHSSTHKQHICMLGKSGASYASNKPCLPCSCLEDVDGVLDKNVVNLNFQFLSGCPEVNASQKPIISKGLVECSSVQSIIADTSVGKPLGHQPGLQEGFALVGEQGKCVNGDQTVSSLMSKKPSLCPTATRGVIGCYEKVAGVENFQEALSHDVFVSDDNICDIHEQKGNNEHINNGLFTASCGVPHSTRASSDLVAEKMLVCETIHMPAAEEAIYDDIGLDVSLDHYIYKTLSLEHYVSHMEDGNKASTPHLTYKEQKSPLEEDSTCAITSANLIQGSNVHLLLQSDGIGETKPVCSSFTFPTGLSPTSITWKEVEETAWKPNFEQHDNVTSIKEQEESPVVKLGPISLRNTITEETFPHIKKELSSSQKEGTVTTVPQSSDKYVDSLSVAEPIRTISGWGSNFQECISKELGAIMSGCHSKRNQSLASEQNQLVLNPKEPAAVFQANEKTTFKVDSNEEPQKFSCDGSHDVGCKCEEGNKDEDEKLLLRLAVLQLAKSILSPLWEAGRIKSKEIYKSITRKVVDKVCVSVQGVNIPRTNESVDRYLLRNKPRIAQLVLAYVNMHPVSL